MNYRKFIAIIFLIVALIFGAVFYLNIGVPESIEGYFKKSYYGQFGPLSICVELLVAGYYLFKANKKANFTLALFGFTVILDILFNLTGILTSGVPVYAMVVFFCFAVVSFWIAFSNSFNLGKISFKGTIAAFVLGNAVEFFFNYL
ncbi:hypothetical protein [Spongiivirga citrea]|uniref:Uncharacterized protein n=1 Tax=Spongiivirga citrea TaxID=1481457 RepID=A0A6M0CVI4_9FLAO|nr:hypothetical protein [Spongiivirga citrea]NER17790.1 hypothetical protein [Spongiivirga citrea]